MTPQGKVSTGIVCSYFITLFPYFISHWLQSFLLTSLEKVSFSYFVFAGKGKRECWLLVALPLALNDADCSPHQLAGLAALLRLLPGLARRYPGEQAAAAFWKFEPSNADEKAIANGAFPERGVESVGKAVMAAETCVQNAVKLQRLLTDERLPPAKTEHTQDLLSRSEALTEAHVPLKNGSDSKAFENIVIQTM